jgi:hypothetical protein
MAISSAIAERRDAFLGKLARRVREHHRLEDAGILERRDEPEDTAHRKPDPVRALDAERIEESPDVVGDHVFFWFFTVAVVRASASGDFQHRGHSGGTEEKKMPFIRACVLRGAIHRAHSRFCYLFLSRAVAAFGRVDVLVSNAMFHLCKDSVPHMGRRKWRRRMYCSHPMRRATFPVR